MTDDANDADVLTLAHALHLARLVADGCGSCGGDGAIRIRRGRPVESVSHTCGCPHEVAIADQVDATGMAAWVANDPTRARPADPRDDREIVAWAAEATERLNRTDDT